MDRVLRGLALYTPVNDRHEGDEDAQESGSQQEQRRRFVSALTVFDDGTGPALHAGR
jgi:hypothetical protein